MLVREGARIEHAGERGTRIEYAGERGTRIEHAGESGVQLSITAEEEAYGDHEEAASNQFYCKSRKKPSRKPCDCQHKHLDQ